MIKVDISTNLDAYNRLGIFPDELPAIPNKGDLIYVNDVYQAHFQSLGLPIKLEVVEVRYNFTEGSVGIEVWHSKSSMEIAKAKGINLLDFH